MNTIYERPVISFPALESPHSGGEGKNFFHYLIRFSVQQLYICVQLVFKTSSMNLTYIYHISVTLGFSYTLLGVMFLLPRINVCAISPQVTPFRGCDTGTVFSRKDVCVCVCGYARMQAGMRVVGGRW